MQHVEKVVKRDVKIIGKEFNRKVSTLSIVEQYENRGLHAYFSLNFEFEKKDKLFSQHYDREDVVWSMLGIDTASSAEPSISVRSLHKVVLSVRQNVVFVDPDEVVPVGPHWC